MMEIFTDADPMRADDYALPADVWRNTEKKNDWGGVMDIEKELQREQESMNVWEAALIEAAQSVVRANRKNTGREPSCSLLAMRIDELREILDDINVYYPGDTDRCPARDSDDAPESKT